MHESTHHRWMDWWGWLLGLFGRRPGDPTSVRKERGRMRRIHPTKRNFNIARRRARMRMQRESRRRNRR